MMPRVFDLPDIGSGLQEAEIIAWKVAVGEVVTADQVLCEVETEKSVVEIPVPHAGVILELAGPPGTTVEVGQMLVIIGETGDTLDAPTSPGDAPAVPALDTKRASGPELATSQSGTATSSPTLDAITRPRAMPGTRKLAQELGVDLGKLAGTGPQGVITRRDVRTAASSRVAGPTSIGGRITERQRLSKLRRTVGVHMTGQWQQVPHVTSHVEADATRLLEMRRALTDRLGTKVPIDALLVAVVAPALRQFPEMNAAIDGGELVVHHYVDMGIAVGSDDGLVVPIVRDADRSSMGDLVAVVTDLIARGRERKLRPDEMGDQTFTISNLGALRGWHATQVIPAGTTGILSFGRAMPRPVVRNGRIEAAPIMAISATHDHRAHDGAYHLQFLNAIIENIEEPSLMLL